MNSFNFLMARLAAARVESKLLLGHTVASCQCAFQEEMKDAVICQLDRFYESIVKQVCMFVDANRFHVGNAHVSLEAMNISVQIGNQCA